MKYMNAISDFNKSCGGKYRFEVGNFRRYIEAKEQNSLENDEYYEKYFNGIRTKHLIECLDHIVGVGIYTTRSMPIKYKSAMKLFFDYLIDSNVIQNSDLYRELRAKDTDPKSFNYLMNEHIKILPAPQKIKVLTDEQAIELIDKCDDLFESERESITYTCGCISIKLMLLTGIKYEALYVIPFSAYNDGILLINGFRIHLPLNLNSQIKHYIKLIKCRFSPEFLFIGANGNPLTPKTSGSPLLTVLKELLQTSATTCLTKFGITNLVSVDTNKSEITELTKAKKNIIDDCTKVKSIGEKEIYINSRLSRLEVYYKL